MKIAKVSKNLLAQETENIALSPETVRRGVDEVFRDPSKGVYYVIEVASPAQIVAQLFIYFCLSPWCASCVAGGGQSCGTAVDHF